MRFQKHLEKLGACQKSRKWAESYGDNYLKAWQECEVCHWLHFITYMDKVNIVPSFNFYDVLAGWKKEFSYDGCGFTKKPKPSDWCDIFRKFAKLKENVVFLE